MSEENQNDEKVEETKESASSKRRAKRKKAKGATIIKYADADQEKKDIMDALIAEIEEDPENDDLIIAFGSEASEGVGEIATEMAEFDKSWSSTSNTFYENDYIGSLGEKFKEVNSLHSAIGGASSVAGKAKEAGNSIIKATSDFFSGWGKAKKNKSEHDEFMAETDKILPTLLADIEQLTSDLENSLDDIEVIDANSRKLGQAWKETVEKLCIFASAGNELLKRFDENIIPEAQEEFEETQDESYLETVQANRDLLSRQILQLEAKALAAQQATKQMLNTARNIKVQRQEINNILLNGDFSRALASTAGVQLSSMKVSKQIGRGQEMNDELMELSTATGEQSQKMLDDSRERGVIDTKKALEMSKRTETMLLESQQRLQKQRGVEEVQRKALEKAMDDLSSASSAHLLESTTAEKPSKRIANQKSKTAFNDNAKGSTGESALDKAKAKAAEKKKAAAPKTK